MLKALRGRLSGRRWRAGVAVVAGLVLSAAGFTVASVVPVFGQTTAPTFSACELAAVFLLPFVAIRMVAATGRAVR